MPLTDLLAAIRTATPCSKFVLASIPVLLLSVCLLAAYLDSIETP